MGRRGPEGPPPPPVVQRIRIQYAKRGRLRFTSHRDFARAFERALRRAQVPMGYSAGFTPHPKISYVGASPTGVASEAEYLEIGVAVAVDPEQLRAALDEALPTGLDIVAAVDVAAAGPGSLADRMQASRWRIELPGITPQAGAAAVEAFLQRAEITVERMTKGGRREINVREPVVHMTVEPTPEQTGAEMGVATGPDGAAAGAVATASGSADQPHAILHVVVRQVTPAVRPDDVVAALRAVAGLALAAPPSAVRLAQGPIDDAGVIGDPLAVDRIDASTPL